MQYYNSILHIYPEITNDDFSLQDDSDGKGPYIKEWTYSQVEPTQEQLEAATLEVEAKQSANKYKHDRAKAYASVEEQLDMQYHDIVNGTTTWKDHIKGVKTKYPKV